MSFTFTRLNISDVILIEPQVFSDDRGLFFESFKESDFFSSEIKNNFVQDNISHSLQGVIRGLHFQKLPKAQAKLVSAIKGEIFDVAVDIRKNSQTYGKWVGEILSEDNHRLLYIPEGFAHGFLGLGRENIVLYSCTNYRHAKSEKAVLWNDKDLKIKWGIKKPIISKKDRFAQKFKDIKFR